MLYQSAIISTILPYSAMEEGRSCGDLAVVEIHHKVNPHMHHDHDEHRIGGWQANGTRRLMEHISVMIPEERTRPTQLIKPCLQSNHRWPMACRIHPVIFP